MSPTPLRAADSSVALPESGFVKSYVAAFEPATEAPRSYHVAMALQLVSMAIGRNAWIELAGRMYFNLYALILGPSTQVRKSTALKFGVRTLAQAAKRHPGLFKSDWIVPTGTISSEALLDRLSNADRGLLVFDEFARLLDGAKSKSYLADFKETLTEVYGGWAPGRLIRSERIEPGPCFLSIAAATTRSRFEDAITSDDVASGFLGRFLIVFAPASDKVLPFPPAPDARAVDRVINELAHIAEIVKGEISFTPEARELVADWYVDKRAALATSEDAELALPIFFRLDGTVRKLAALMEAAARPRPNLQIEEEAARDAIAYADFLLEQIRAQLLDGILGDISRKLHRLVSHIEAHPGIHKSELQKRTNLYDPEFTRLVELLESEGKIRLERNQGRNRKGIAYYPDAEPELLAA